MIKDKTKLVTRVNTSLVKKDEKGEPYEVIERVYEHKKNGELNLLDQKVYKGEEAKQKAEKYEREKENNKNLKQEG